MLYNKVCAICGVQTDNESNIVSHEFWLCPTCRTFFKEYMKKRMEESNKKTYVMKNHD